MVVLADSVFSGVPLLTVLALGLVVLLGGALQAVAGFGVALAAVPVVVLVAPELLPGGLLVCGCVLPMAQLIVGPREIDRQLVTWALLGRFASTAAGVYAVSVASRFQLAVLVAVVIAVAVVATLKVSSVPTTRASSMGAGFLSGFSGTAVAIGGPFVALVMAGRPPHVVRSTLSVFFILGALASLAGLGLGGQLQSGDLLAGVVWLPFVLAGFFGAQPWAKKADTAKLKRITLLISAAACPLVIVLAALQNN